METRKIEAADTANVAIEKAGVSFSIRRPGGPIVIDCRLHHDTISALKGVQVALELLNGISVEQAKRIVDVLNENVLGILVTSVADNKTQAASS